MSRPANDLDVRLDKLDRDRRQLSEALSFLVETNRELATGLAEAVESPAEGGLLQRAAQRQAERLGACVEQLVTLLAEQEEAIRTLRDTLSDVRRVLPS